MVDNGYLVGGLEHVFFSMSYMGCHPKPIDELVPQFQSAAEKNGHQGDPEIRWFLI